MSDLFPQLLRQARSICRSRGLHRPADIDDTVQNACEAILKNWQTLHADSNLSAWIGTIISNRAIDIHRRGGRTVSIDQPPPGDDDAPSRVVEPSLTHDPAHEDCVARVLDQLDHEGPARAGSIRTIELIVFVIDHGTDTAALAEFLNCSESAAKERKRYALQKFNELCVKFCESDECAATVAR